MNRNKKTYFSFIFYLIPGFFVLAYITNKAAVSSFTHDESFTYLHYVHTGAMDIISFKDWFTNNHILNSLLMKYSEILFGNSEIALRLPNIILFVVFLVYSYLLLKRDKLIILSVSAFVLLIFNNAMVDLFGLARGYGLSFGFMLMSIYHLIYYHVKKKSNIHIFLFHFASLFAILSNFTLVDIYLALLVISNILNYLDCKKIYLSKFNFFKANKNHFIPILINIIVLYEPLRRLIFNSHLDFGGKNGFYGDTVSYLIYYLLHQSQISYTSLIILRILITLIVLVPTVIIFFRIIIKDDGFYSENKELIITNFLIIIVSLGIILQHLIFKSDYPVERFSLFLLPVFILYIIYLFYFLGKLYKKTITIISIIFALFTVIIFIQKMDFYICSEWQYDSQTKSMLLKFNELHPKKDNSKIKLGIDWIFEPSFNYYRITKKLNWMYPADRCGIKPTDDYFYMFKNDTTRLNGINYKILFEFNKSETVLIKNLNECP